jgi:hypothetical protein
MYELPEAFVSPSAAATHFPVSVWAKHESLTVESAKTFY